MELSLFSRDVIALSAAVGLSHGMFESVLMLGICDKIVPGLLIGALRFGHLATILVPGGPMPSGLANKEKARVRQLYAEGKATEQELLEAMRQEAMRYGPQAQQVFDMFRQNPNAQAQLRAPIFEDKVVDYVFELADVSEKEVDKDELQKAVEALDDDDA